jgi:hypothetical protein
MAHPALLILILSGLATFLLNDWNSLYKLNLLLHPLLGVLFTALMYYFAWRRFERLEPRFSVRRWVGAPMVLSVAFAFPGIASRSGGRFYLLVAALLAILLVGLWRLSRALEPREWFVAACNYIGFGLWVITLFSGLTVISLSSAGGLTEIVLFHRTVTLAFTCFFVLLVVLSLTGIFAKSHAFTDEQPNIRALLRGLVERRGQIRDEQPRAWSALLWTGLAALVLATLVGAERLAEVSAPSFTVPLSTIPVERRIAGERVVRFDDERVPAAALELTRSCASGQGCHDSITHSFRHSNHAISMKTPHMNKILDLMSSEVGEHNIKICAGCHVPSALFRAGASGRSIEGQEDISCSFCHMVRDVWVGPKHSTRSSYTLRPPVRHLEMFLEDGAEKEPGFLDSFLIRLNPLGHARQFSAPLLASDRFCDSCHHHQIRSERQAGLVRPRCIDCHMRPLHEVGGAGEVRSHFMPGANLTVPLFAGRPEAVRLIGDWIDGKFPFSIAGWENRGWERLGGRAQATWLWMLYEIKSDPRPGSELALEIITANVGMEHPFPAAPLDLIDAWLELRVHDANGRLVFAHGIADFLGNIPADAHRVGGTVLDENGSPVEHYRVWFPQRDVIDRVMQPGVPIRDRYEFTIPTDVVGPLQIAAEWKYRKLNRRILDWLYGPETTVPTLVIGSMNGSISLAPNPQTATRPGSSPVAAPGAQAVAAHLPDSITRR